MLALFVTIVALVGTFVLLAGALMYIVVALFDRRPTSLRVPAGMLCGFIGGMLVVWCVLPRDWPLPFWTTFAATVNAAKYGHPVEHAAEGIVTWMLFAAVIGALLGGWTAQAIGRRRLSPE